MRCAQSVAPVGGDGNGRIQRAPPGAESQAWKYETWWSSCLPACLAMLHFKPHLISYRSSARSSNDERYPALGDALSRRSRSRHLLLALFFPATRHLHNYNLASAVSKTLGLCTFRGPASTVLFHIDHPCTFVSELVKRESEEGRKEKLLPSVPQARKARHWRDTRLFVESKKRMDDPYGMKYIFVKRHA